jgi:hypothetical protein
MVNVQTPEVQLILVALAYVVIIGLKYILLCTHSSLE